MDEKLQKFLNEGAAIYHEVEGIVIFLMSSEARSSLLVNYNVKNWRTKMPLPDALTGDRWTECTARKLLPLIVWCAKTDEQ